MNTFLDIFKTDLFEYINKNINPTKFETPFSETIIEMTCSKVIFDAFDNWLIKEAEAKSFAIKVDHVKEAPSLEKTITLVIPFLCRVNITSDSNTTGYKLTN